MVIESFPALVASVSAWARAQDFSRPAQAEAVLLAYERDVWAGQAVARWSRKGDRAHPWDGQPIPVMVAWDDLLAALREAGLAVERPQLGGDIVRGWARA